MGAHGLNVEKRKARVLKFEKDAPASRQWRNVVIRSTGSGRSADDHADSFVNHHGLHESEFKMYGRYRAFEKKSGRKVEVREVVVHYFSDHKLTIPR